MFTFLTKLFATIVIAIICSFIIFSDEIKAHFYAQESAVVKRHLLRENVNRYMSGQPVRAAEFPWFEGGRLDPHALNYWVREDGLTSVEAEAFRKRESYWKRLDK